MPVGSITSLHNVRMRRVQALLRSARRRAREGLLLAEGLRLVREAVLAECAITWAFYTADFATDPRGADLLRDLQQRRIALWEVTPSVMAELSATQTPQGIVAVLSIPQLPEKKSPGLTLILDRLRDPGNLGTILRAAWATDVRCVLLPPGTVDFTNPKVVRAGMGAHFHVPIRRRGWDEIHADVAGTPVWLAEAGAGIPYDAVDWSGDVTLIVGGEAEGAGPESRALAGERRVTIPMAAGVESLNAAIATAVLLFEAARQRRVG